MTVQFPIERISSTLLSLINIAEEAIKHQHNREIMSVWLKSYTVNCNVSEEFLGYHDAQYSIPCCLPLLPEMLQICHEISQRS